MFKDLTVSDLRDESRLAGWAEVLARPASETEAAELVRHCAGRGLGLTAQGARTGLVGAAVPFGGWVVSSGALAGPTGLGLRPDGNLELTVRPGYSLAELRRDLNRRRFDWAGPPPGDPRARGALAERPWFWPPDPSQETATLGGLASTKAGGPGALKFGSVARHIAGLRVILADGRPREFRRGAGSSLARGRLKMPAGPSLDLNQAALGLDPGAEALDIFIGGQGMFGLITELTLLLRPRPAATWGLALFFGDESGAAAFLDQARGLAPDALTALDYLDEAALAAVAELKNLAAKLREIPDPPAGARAMVQVELQAGTEAEVEEAAGLLMAAAEAAGGDLDQSWALAGDEMEKLRLFRHAVPEALNGRLDQLRLKDPEVLKTGGDMTWPGFTPAEALARFRADLAAAGLAAVVFGHVGAGGPWHVNFLPEDEYQRTRARGLLWNWLLLARAQGGRLFQEHGVGKTKRDLFQACEAPAVKSAWRAVKAILDPGGLFNPGNMFAGEDGP